MLTVAITKKEDYLFAFFRRKSGKAQTVSMVQAYTTETECYNIMNDKEGAPYAKSQP
ncbi:hypothetical protein PPM_1072 [Paenibacillus polymyxa M1]|nr:hypothetical protein PPM_1072 [Paenibacillus polymyxa M1]